MNEYDNGKTSFALGFSSFFVLKYIKMMVTGLFPRLLHKKKIKMRVFFLCVALCEIENCHSLKIIYIFWRYSFMQVLYFMRSCRRTQENSACHPRSRAREGGSMFFTVNWEYLMLFFGTCEMP